MNFSGSFISMFPVSFTRWHFSDVIYFFRSGINMPVVKLFAYRVNIAIRINSKIRPAFFSDKVNRIALHGITATLEIRKPENAQHKCFIGVKAILSEQQVIIMKIMGLLYFQHPGRTGKKLNE